MKIGPYSFDEFTEKVKAFHGSIAPGIVAGGIMVDIAKANLPEGEFFDVIAESQHCLPDAVQPVRASTVCLMPCSSLPSAPSVTAGSRLSTQAATHLPSTTSIRAKASGYTSMQKN